MSQTPITVTYSLEEVLGEIKQSIKEVNQKLDSIQKDVNDLKVDVKELSTEIKGINKRLDSQEFINRSIAVGILLAFNKKSALVRQRTR